MLPANVRYPEGKPAMYYLLPGGFSFGPKMIVKPLLKQMQLQGCKLWVGYNAKKDRWDAHSFHCRVEGGGGVHRACQGLRRMGVD